MYHIHVHRESSDFTSVNYSFYETERQTKLPEFVEELHIVQKKT